MLACLLSLLGADAVQAQVGSLFAPAARESEPSVSDIIEQAAEQGVGVIVIDPDGNVLSPAVSGPSAEPAPSTSSSGAGLMEAQETVVAFRTVLFERLANLPDAGRDVAEVIRSKSPDGTLFAFVQILLTSLAFFAIGMAFERYIYGRRIAVHFVKRRIRENPQGYSEKMPFLAMRFFAGVLGIFVSVIVAYAIGFTFYGPIEDSSVQYTATLINIGYVSARFVAGVWRMILSPYLQQYRIPHLSDACAKHLHLWLCIVVSWAL